MSVQQNGSNKGMTDFELGATLSRIEAKVDGAISGLNDFKKSHADLEVRTRTLEANSATKAELLALSLKLEDIKTMQWKTLIYLALGAGGAGGGVAALVNLIA